MTVLNLTSNTEVMYSTVFLFSVQNIPERIHSWWPMIAGLHLVSQSLYRGYHRINVFSGWRLPADSTGVRSKLSELRGYSIIRVKISDWIVVPYHAWTVSLKLFLVVGWCWSHYIATVMTVGSLVALFSWSVILGV